MSDPDETRGQILQEIEPLLAKLQPDLEALEEVPADGRRAGALHRKLLTIKGAASYCGFTRSARVAQAAVDLLDALSRGEITLSEAALDGLGQAVALLATTLSAVRSTGGELAVTTPPAEDVERILKALATGQANAPPPKRSSDEVGEEALEGGSDRAVAEKEAGQAEKAEDGSRVVPGASDRPLKGTIPHAPVSAEPATRNAKSDSRESDTVATIAAGDVPDQLIAEDANAELLELFLADADEIVGSLDRSLVQLEDTPDDRELLDHIFRGFHTLKGNASMLGITRVSFLAHHTESVLVTLRKETFSASAKLMDAILGAVDGVKTLLQEVRTGKRSSLDLPYILGELVRCATASPPAASAAPTPASSAPKRKPPEAPAPPARGPLAPEFTGSPRTIRVDVQRLDFLLNLTGELILTRNRLLDLQTRLAPEIASQSDAAALEEVTGTLDRLTKDLQVTVMKTRMQPVKQVFDRFPRLVRDLARDLGKRIRLEISGADTEIDRTILGAIHDPLVHVLRNSADHGIEPPEVRKQAGKPEEGIIQLRAYREGGQIVIQIHDDGAGIDLEKIREKVISRGILSRQHVARLSDRECLGFIFQPGFTTSEQATAVSGRGVGMDVVRSNVERLNGSIDVAASRGEGTTLTIRFPLTLAVVDALLVEVDERIYALPLSMVHESIRVRDPRADSTEWRGHGGRKTSLTLRETVIPLYWLRCLLGLPEAPLPAQSGAATAADKGRESGGEAHPEGEAGQRTSDPEPHDLRRSGAATSGLPTRRGRATSGRAATIPVVVATVSGRQIGLVADRVIAREELVIKPLVGTVADVPGIAGASIRGDGQVVLMLDVPRLVGEETLHATSGRAAPLAADAPAASAPEPE